jgi:dihydroorotate dehydrogenase (fumarate)
MSPAAAMLPPDLSTSWLGLPLRSPLVVGAAAPLSGDVGQLLELERYGAAAIVLHSLFEEQLEHEQLAMHRQGLVGSDSHAEALSYVAEAALFHGGPDHYLRLIEQGRARLPIPLVASLNGCHRGSWVRFARQLESAGAQALELNIYAIPTDPERSSASIEAELVAIVAEVAAAVTLPLAVKLGPFYTNLAALAQQLEQAGAAGLTLFNRFYQPDLDIEALEIRSNLLLSTPHDLRLPLRWIALLHGRRALDLAASGGVHRGTDLVRLLMAGACCTQVVGALLRHGPGRLAGLLEELGFWLAEHGYGSLRQLIGCLDQRHCADPAAYERAQYIQALQSYPLADAISGPGPW